MKWFQLENNLVFFGYNLFIFCIGETIGFSSVLHAIDELKAKFVLDKKILSYSYEESLPKFQVHSFFDPKKGEIS